MTRFILLPDFLLLWLARHKAKLHRLNERTNPYGLNFDGSGAPCPVPTGGGKGNLLRGTQPWPYRCRMRSNQRNLMLDKYTRLRARRCRLLALFVASLPLLLSPAASGQPARVKASGKLIRIQKAEPIPTDSLRQLLKMANLTDSTRYLVLSKLSERLINEGNREAIEVTLKALAHARQMNHPEFITRTLFNIGFDYQKFADYPTSFRYLQQGALYSEKQGLTKYTWNFYNSMGAIGLYTNEYELSIKYLRLAYRLQQKVPVQQLRANLRVSMLVNLVNMHLRREEPDSANYYAQLALPIAQAAKDIRGLAFLYGLKGTTFTTRKPGKLEYVDSAIAYLNRSYEYAVQARDMGTSVASQVGLAQAYRQKGKPAASQAAAGKALELSRKAHNANHEVKALRWLSYAYADQGNYTQSLVLSDRAETLKDSLLNAEKYREMGALQVRFDVDRLKQQNRLAAEQSRAARAQTKTAAALAVAQQARVQLLTQRNRAAEAQQQVQRTNIELLAEQNRAAAAETQTQTARVQLLTQEKRAARVAALQQEKNQRSRFQSLIIWLCVLGLCLVAGLMLYWRLRRQSEQLAEANEKNAQSAAEKEVLLQEIHHRVKNNLAIVNSLLSWQSSALPDPALVEVLRSSQSRIHSMALVHEFLYQADNLSAVRLDDYLRRLLQELHQNLTTPTQNISLTSELAPLALEAKVAFNFGLLTNELITNTLKHAFRGRSSGHLHVELSGTAESFRLVVADDGVGMPDAETLRRNPASLGTKLINTMAKQLKAVLTVEPNLPSGTRVVITQAATVEPNLSSARKIASQS